MNSHQFEKYAACCLIAALTVIFGMEQAIAGSANVKVSSDTPHGLVGTGQPTCGC